MCPSSEETTIFMRHLVLVILCGWLSGMHTSHSKHIEKRNKHFRKNCATSWLYLQDYIGMHGQQSIKNKRLRIFCRFILKCEHYSLSGCGVIPSIVAALTNLREVSTLPSRQNKMEATSSSETPVPSTKLHSFKSHRTVIMIHNTVRIARMFKGACFLVCLERHTGPCSGTHQRTSQVFSSMLTSAVKESKSSPTHLPLEMSQSCIQNTA